MTTEPTDKQKEEARERIWLLRNEDGSFDDCWQASTLSGTPDVEYVRADILSEIREVLEGLMVWRGECWCRDARPPSRRGTHLPACLATQRLWEKLQPAKGEKDA